MGKHLCFTAMIVLLFANILAVQGERHSKFFFIDVYSLFCNC